MKKGVLVMGGSLFIGVEVVNKLLENNYNVTICNRGNNPLNIVGVEEIYTDRNDKESLKSLLSNRKFEYVIDISGLNKKHIEKLYEALNKKYLKNYIFVSSSAVYQESSTLPFLEDIGIGKNKFWQDYGLDKIEAEKFLKEKFEKEKFPFIALRPPYVYGPNNYVYREAYLFERILEGKKIIIPSRGETKIQFIHVKDLANMIITLLERDDLVGEIFNSANKEYISFNEWVNIAMEVVGKRVEVIHFDNKNFNYDSRDFFPFYEYEYYLDTNKLNNICKSKIDFKEGMKESFDWYQNYKEKVLVKEHIYENEKKILKLLEKN